jgi:hypothetical protein
MLFASANKCYHQDTNIKDALNKQTNRLKRRATLKHMYRGQWIDKVKLNYNFNEIKSISRLLIFFALLQSSHHITTLQNYQQPDIQLECHKNCRNQWQECTTMTVAQSVCPSIFLHKRISFYTSRTSLHANDNNDLRVQQAIHHLKHWFTSLLQNIYTTP